MQGSTTITRKPQVVDPPPTFTDAEPRGEVSTADAGRVAITFHRTLGEIESLWRGFEQSGICSVYQRFDWVSNWMETSGKGHNSEPYIIVGRVDGSPQFLFPFALFYRGPFCVAKWIGDSHTNFNLGIYSIEFLKKVRLDDMRAIFDLIVKRSVGIDAFKLCSQPMSWQGYNNPLNFLRRLESPDHAFSMQLATTFDEVLAQHNGKKKRKKYRSQMRVMDPLGGAKLIRAETPEQIARILDASLEQIKVRLGRMGVTNMFEEEGIRSFFYNLAVLSIGKTEPSLLIYGLEVDGKIRATFAGGSHQQRFSGYFTSIAMDELTSTSPGDMLLYLVIEDCTKRGYASFDLGRGEERYKSSWCNEVVPMFESFIPVSRKALILILFDHAEVTLKRIIKQNPKLRRLAKKARASWR